MSMMDVYVFLDVRRQGRHCCINITIIRIILERRKQDSRSRVNNFGLELPRILRNIASRAMWGRSLRAPFFMDVAGAFNKVRHKRLYHNMRKSVPDFIVRWAESFLTGRSTCMRG